MPKHEELYKTAQVNFQAATDAEVDQRHGWLEDMRFVGGEQWDSNAEKQRAGRPCLTINKVAATSKRIVGAGKQNRPGLKARPFDSKSDPVVATVLTGIIKNICNMSNAVDAFDLGYTHAVNGGFGYWRILTTYAGPETFDQEIQIKRIVNPLSVYFDPWAEEADLSDANWAFITNELDRKAAEEKYPSIEGAVEWGDESKNTWVTKDSVQEVEYFWKKDEEIKVLLLSNGETVKESDIPKEDIFDNGEQKGVYYPDGSVFAVGKERTSTIQTVMWCKFVGDKVVEGPIELKGKYIPIVRCSGEEEWIEGSLTLRSAIHWAKEPGRLYNWARSNEVETLALHPKQPFILTTDQIEGHKSQWDKARYTPMPYLLINPTEFGTPRRDGASMPDSGAVMAAREASDDIKATTGVYDASLGRASNETSGKAIMARQTEGDIATYVFPDNLEKAIIYTGKILVDLIPLIYDAERVIRIINDEDALVWAEINKTVLGPNGENFVKNDLLNGLYDVVLDVDAGYRTRREEAAAAMSELLRYAPDTAPVVVPRLAKSLDWPDSGKIAQELQNLYSPPKPQEPSPAEQMEMHSKELEVAKKELEVEEQRLETEQEALRVQQLEMAIEGEARREVLGLNGKPTVGQTAG